MVNLYFPGKLREPVWFMNGRIALMDSGGPWRFWCRLRGVFG